MTRDAYTGGRDAADVPPPARIPSVSAALGAWHAASMGDTADGQAARRGLGRPKRKPDPRVTDEDVDFAIGAYSIVTMNGGPRRDRMRAALETALEPTGLVGRAIAVELERIAHDHADGVALDHFGAALLRGLADAWREGRR